jgi:hypothetical protein
MPLKEYFSNQVELVVSQAPVTRREAAPWSASLV